MHSHGTVPSGGVDPRRDASWFAQMADEYARRWSHDPVGSALEMFAPGCTSGHVGRFESHGIDELAGSRQLLLGELPVPGREMQLHRVAGEGSAVAMLITVGDATHLTRGTVVLTFDSNDLIVSERTYCDWSKAVPRPEPGSRPAVGSPGWTTLT